MRGTAPYGLAHRLPWAPWRRFPPRHSPTRRIPMRSLPHLLMLGSVLACAAPAAHPEDHHGHPSFTDLRVEGSVLPDTLEADGSAEGPLGSVSRSGDVEFEDAWRVGIIGVTARSDDSGIVAFGTGGGTQSSRCA